MKIGTKSILFGAHCWFIHPFFVARAWWKLYGFPWDPRLWVAFFVHDLGYWGCSNMDGDEGEAHVFLGARIMGNFDSSYDFWHEYNDPKSRVARRLNKMFGRVRKYGSHNWYSFCFYHSRFMAKRYKMPFSRLCVADKLSISLEPWWFYLPRVILSGEIKEYMALAASGKYESMSLNSVSKRKWFEDTCAYLRSWVDEHKDMKEDTWTPSTTSHE